MNKTKIDWADSTWNPITGCLHPCEYCYAKGMIARFAGHWDDKQSRHCGGNGMLHDLYSPMYRHTTGKNRDKPVHSVISPYPFGFDPTFHRYLLDRPEHWKEPRNIFAVSMGDMFGEWVPDWWIKEVFEACEKAPQHRYLFLTKNPRRYVELATKGLLPVNKNFWYGSTITTPDDEYYYDKHGGGGRKRFVSIEPLIEPFESTGKTWTDWVIVGAETGNRKSKIIPRREWIENIVEQCRAASVPVFMKSSLADIWGEPLIQQFPWKEMEK